MSKADNEAREMEEAKRVAHYETLQRQAERDKAEREANDKRK